MTRGLAASYVMYAVVRRNNMATNSGKEAKEYLENRMSALFGSDYIGTFGDKLYLWSKDKAGEKVQIAITMTCPKTPVEAPAAPAGHDWSKTTTKVEEKPKLAAPSAEETENIKRMLKNLGL